MFVTLKNDQRYNQKLDDIVMELRANPNVDAQIIAELEAGKHYLNAPRLKLAIVEELVLSPLQRLVKSPPTQRIANEATIYRDWLRRGLQRA